MVAATRGPTRAGTIATVDFVGMKGTTTGYGDVYLDRAFMTTVNLTGLTSAQYKLALWTSATLPFGARTLEVRYNSLGGTKYMTFATVKVNGIVVP
jgi:hypothetical protein